MAENESERVTQCALIFPPHVGAVEWKRAAEKPMADSLDDAWTTVFCQRPYNPYRGGNNPAFRSRPGLDGRLLDFKQGYDDAIRSETAVLLDAIEKLDLRDAIVTIIPGHEATAPAPLQVRCAPRCSVSVRLGTGRSSASPSRSANSLAMRRPPVLCDPPCSGAIRYE